MTETATYLVPFGGLYRDGTGEHRMDGTIWVGRDFSQANARIRIITARIDSQSHPAMPEDLSLVQYQLPMKEDGL
jgi:hypothetical protein